MSGCLFIPTDRAFSILYYSSLTLMCIRKIGHFSYCPLKITTINSAHSASKCYYRSELEFYFHWQRATQGKEIIIIEIPNTLNINFIVALLCKALIAKIASKWFHSFMNWSYVCIQVVFLCKAGITNITFVRLFSFMNWFIVRLHSLFCCKTSITNFTVERLLSLMYWCQMSVQIGL